MSDSKINSVLIEKRSFAPSAETTAKASKNAIGD